MPDFVVESGSQGLAAATHDYAASIYVLSVLTGFVLLLACANLANLLLARSAARQREMSVRLALGATRSRVLRQVLTESLLLSSLGGIAGFVLGYLGRNIIPHLLSSAWRPAPLNARFDLRIFAFTAAVSILTGILFGLAPAWQATRSDVNTALKDSASSATPRRKGLAGQVHRRHPDRALHAPRHRSRSLRAHADQSQHHQPRLRPPSPTALHLTGPAYPLPRATERRPPPAHRRPPR